MNFKTFISIALLILISSCNYNYNKNNIEASDEVQPKILYKGVSDTIVFATSNKKNVFAGEMVYPKTKSLNSKAFDDLIKKGVVSINVVNDTLFVFLCNELLCDYENEYLPEINDSVFKYFYPKYYNVEIDDDIPYFVYISNSKDNLVLIKDKKKGVYQWNNAMIRDTILSVFGGVKIGMEKEQVFKKLNLPTFQYEKNDFSMILCDANTPNRAWFKEKLNNPRKSTTTALLKFEGGKLDYIILNSDIGFYESF